MPSGKVICVRFDEEVLKLMDRRAASANTDRSGWIRGLVFEALGRTVRPKKPHVPGKTADPQQIPSEPVSPLQTLPCESGHHPPERIKDTKIGPVCLDCGGRV